MLLLVIIINSSLLFTDITLLLTLYLLIGLIIERFQPVHKGNAALYFLFLFCLERVSALADRCNDFLSILPLCHAFVELRNDVVALFLVEGFIAFLDPKFRRRQNLSTIFDIKQHLLMSLVQRAQIHARFLLPLFVLEDLLREILGGVCLELREIVLNSGLHL